MAQGAEHGAARVGVGDNDTAAGKDARLREKRCGEHGRVWRFEQRWIDAGTGGHDDVDRPARAAVDHGPEHRQVLVHDRAEGDVDGVCMRQCGKLRWQRGIWVDLAGRGPQRLHRGPRTRFAGAGSAGRSRDTARRRRRGPGPGSQRRRLLTRSLQRRRTAAAPSGRSRASGAVCPALQRRSMCPAQTCRARRGRAATSASGRAHPGRGRPRRRRTSAGQRTPSARRRAAR